MSKISEYIKEAKKRADDLPVENIIVPQMNVDVLTLADALEEAMKTLSQYQYNAKGKVNDAEECISHIESLIEKNLEGK